MTNYISTSNTDDDIDITSINKEYDLLAREVLSTKQILAYLLKLEFPIICCNYRIM